MVPPKGLVDRLEYRIVEVPRQSGEDHLAELRMARGRALPGLSLAHALAQPVASCWIRRRPSGPMAVLMGGRGATPTPSGVLLREHPGVLARTLPAGQVEQALNQLGHWECAEISFAATPAEADRLESLGLEDVFALLPAEVMAIGVIADPVPRHEIEAMVSDLSDTVGDLQPHAEGRGSKRLELERAEAQMRYLDQWSGFGFWRIQIWAGSADASACRGVIGLLAGTDEVLGVPFRLRPSGATIPADPTSVWSESAVVGADVVSSLVRCPSRELPGIRVVDLPTFDTTPEVTGPLVIGHVLDATRQPVGEFRIPTDAINKHVFVTGATGSGKSQTVRTLLQQLSAAPEPVPWMVIEPAKSEYAVMAGRLVASGGEVQVIRPGDPSVPPASLNPLEPSSIVIGSPPRRVFFPLQTHIDLVRALFTASFQAEEPFPQILARALTRSYEERGWNLAVGRSLDGDESIRPGFPWLADLRRCALEVVDDVKYGREVSDNVRGFVDVRIGSLQLGTPGRFFQGGHPLDLDALLSSNVVFEIEDLGDDNDKAFFIGCVLIRLIELLRLRQQHGLIPAGLRHVVVIEEAHRLLRTVDPDSPAAQAVTMFADLLAEVRAYGEGIVIAEQIPSKIIPDVVKNSAVKVVHRLPSADDRDFVGSTMNLDEAQSEFVVALSRGRAAVHVEQMDRPVLVDVSDGTANEARSPRHIPPVMTVRSMACPSACAGEPCSVETLARADRRALDPNVMLWSELTVLAHLCGEPPGCPGSPWLDQLAEDEARTLRCAIGLAVDASVDRRSTVIRRQVDPRRVKKQVATVMESQLAHRRPVEWQGPRWQVGRYRWVDVIRHLDAEPEPVQTREGPYDVPTDWAARGLSLSGTWTEVREQVLRASARDLEPSASLLFGTPAVMSELIDEIGRGSTRTERLTSATSRIGMTSAGVSNRLKWAWVDD